MSDLESSLLKAALDFARARAEELLDNLIADALALLREVVPVPTPAQLAAVNAIEPAVATDLSTAKNDVVAFGTQLAAAADLSAIEAAFASLSAALTAVDAAIEKVTTAAGVPAAGVLGGLVKKAVAAVGDEFSGLIEQLGLCSGGGLSDGFTSSGKVISYQLANAAARPIPPAPEGTLTLSDTTLTASLDYSAPLLSLKLVTGLAVNLASDGFVQQLTGASAGVTTTLTVTVDTADGLRFQAGAKARADLDGSLSLPGVDLKGLGIEIPDGVPLGLALTGALSGSLGPIDAVIQGAGIGLALDPAKLLSGQPISLVLQPPTGAGLSVDAGVVHGGWWLRRAHRHRLRRRAGPRAGPDRHQSRGADRHRTVLAGARSVGAFHAGHPAVLRLHPECRRWSAGDRADHLHGCAAGRHPRSHRRHRAVPG
jgi:hypothetical protein